ncbi:MAG: hypothetical protein FD167_3761, partial [bacterium]
MSTTEKTNSYVLNKINKYKKLYPEDLHLLLEKFVTYAAIPVALNSELLHLLRINFFLDPPNTLPYTVEADLLLSPLCEEIGDTLYEIHSETRDYLLGGLTDKQDNRNEINEVATLLWQYTQRSKAWLNRLELDRAQKLTALNLLDKAKAKEWLDEKEIELNSQSSSNKRWFVAMRKELNIPNDKIITKVDLPPINVFEFEFNTVKVDAKGKIIERNKKQAKQFIEELGNGIKLEMVEIPGGSFMMGTSPDD